MSERETERMRGEGVGEWKGGGRDVIDEGKSDFENIELNSFFNVKEARVEGRQIRVKYREQDRNKEIR